MSRNSRTVEELRWHKFPVLDDGFVCLVDVMGSDSSIVQAARVSYGKDERQELESVIAWSDQDRKGEHKTQVQLERESKRDHLAAKDRNLIRYLMRHRHTTPFEMAEVKLLVRVPMDCWRQWIRHRTASVNEYSTRYTEAIDSAQKTDPGEWRTQSKSNKQGSSSHLMDGDDPMMGTVAKQLTDEETRFHKKARDLYERRLEAGVAREQARKDLPLSTYTEAYWKCDLHNILHFLGLRMDSHAQHEIRQYATIIGEQIIKPLFPVVWEAFEDYRFGGMFLTRLDQQVIRQIQNKKGTVSGCLESIFENKREREECVNKLKSLGVL